MKNVLVLIALGVALCCSTAVRAQQDAEPSRDEFVDIEEEPQPLVPIEQLIQYPESARRSGLQGKVVLQALIEKDGTVSRVEVLTSEYDIFRDEAIRAMKSARFTPAKQHGAPVRVWVTRTIRFKLTEPAPPPPPPPDTARAPKVTRRLVPKQ